MGILGKHNVIKHCFWNIQGYKSQVLGNKLISTEFLSVINDYDIVGLAETHIHDQILSELDIPGYTRIHYKNRMAHSNGKCGSGGTAIFCKTDMSEFFNVSNNAHDGVIWIRIRKGLYGGDEDTYLATCYLPPNGNKETNVKTFEKLAGEITQFQKKGKVILQGDFNARTNKEEDTIEPDKYDEDLGISFTQLPSRNSEDSEEVNIRGGELLNLCKSLNMAILNGRKTGDIFGKYTSIHWNGKAVVDYGVVPTDLFEEVSYFSVGNYSPFISDHCPIFFEIKATPNKKTIPEPKLEESPKFFKIKSEDHEKLVDALKTQEMETRLSSLSNQTIGPQELVSEITSILLDACDLAEIKPVRNKNSSSNNNKPWFDKDCQKLKNSIKKM